MTDVSSNIVMEMKSTQKGWERENVKSGIMSRKI
jgi:hypothetical protein